jgi:holo-[acyl-carrier protein] synthase
MLDDGVVASALELVEIAELERALAAGAALALPFTPEEWAYARSKSDPARRLAARLAAKRAAVRLLGRGVAPAEIEVRRAPGSAPRLVLSAGAGARLAELGAAATLVSLSHGREHAAAAVLLLRS